MSQWIRGRKAIMAEVQTTKWDLVKKYIEMGAPIRNVGGSMLTLRSLLNSWLAEQLTQKVPEKLRTGVDSNP